MHLKGKNLGVILLLDDKAKKLSELMQAYAEKKIDDTWVKTELWQGWLSDVKSIEFDQERTYSKPSSSEPMTDAEKEAAEKAYQQVRENLKQMGIIRK